MSALPKDSHGVRTLSVKYQDNSPHVQHRALLLLHVGQNDPQMFCPRWSICIHLQKKIRGESDGFNKFLLNHIFFFGQSTVYAHECTTTPGEVSLWCFIRSVNVDEEENTSENVCCNVASSVRWFPQWTRVNRAARYRLTSIPSATFSGTIVARDIKISSLHGFM